MEPDDDRDQRGNEHRFPGLTADHGDDDDQQPLQPVDLAEPSAPVGGERSPGRGRKKAPRGQHQPHRDDTADDHHNQPHRPPERTRPEQPPSEPEQREKPHP
ncbi:hypothetical protein [Streptomyces stelliscabiei]|uniref:hypothetical protein n=1 Tax=Streptomyces stelliscabiei TaxID=146820 RepID=UPI002FF15554